MEETPLDAQTKILEEYNKSTEQHKKYKNLQNTTKSNIQVKKTTKCGKA